MIKHSQKWVSKEVSKFTCIEVHTVPWPRLFHLCRPFQGSRSFHLVHSHICMNVSTRKALNPSERPHEGVVRCLAYFRCPSMGGKHFSNNGRSFKWWIYTQTQNDHKSILDERHHLSMKEMVSAGEDLWGLKPEFFAQPAKSKNQ